MSHLNSDKVTIHLWIGNNFSSDEEYKNYFHQFEGIQKDYLNLKPSCPFCADIGNIAYMTENLIMLEKFSSPKDIDFVINKVEVNENEKKNIIEKCNELGIKSANAVFWYVNNDPILELEVKEPYKENYNGLKYIGEFEADSKYPIIEQDDLTKNWHLWIGTNTMPTREYNKYFKLDYKHDIDSPKYIICDFCKDTGNDWYDEDFIGYPKPLKKSVKIDKLIDEFVTSDLDCIQQIETKCHQLGIEQANAVVWYIADDELSEFNIQKPLKENYNGLKYIGIFRF